MALKASIYQAEGNLEEAAKWLAQVNTQTNSDVAVRIKLTQLRFERSPEGIRWVQGRQARLPFTAGIERGSKQVGVALAHHVAGDTASARTHAEEARNTLESLKKDQPDNAFVAAALAVAYAVLDEKDSALHEAQRAMMLSPTNQDRLSGPAFEENLALVEMIIGENDHAVAIFTRLLQTPYGGWLYSPTPITPALLRLDPLWDPLRTDPAFKKLYRGKGAMNVDSLQAPSAFLLPCNLAVKKFSRRTELLAKDTVPIVRRKEARRASKAKICYQIRRKHNDANQANS